MSKEICGLFPNRLPSAPGQLKHIFAVRSGHLADTPKNRDTLSILANDQDCYKGRDKWGNDWYIRTLGNGGQHWVEVRDGIIFEGGYNRTPKEWNPETGLKSKEKPSTIKPKIKLKKKH